MEKKSGVYICGGCGISEAIDVEKLSGVSKNEFKIPVSVHPFLCSPEGLEQIRKDVAEEGINSLVIAACSPRAKTEAFSFESQDHGVR